MKKILIIGATSGIGRRVAEDFVQMGWLVGAAGRNEKALDELKAQGMVTEHIDVCHDSCPEKMLKLLSRMKGADVILVASGVLHEGSLNLRNEIDTLETNVVGFGRVVTTAYRYFRSCTSGGRIACITSVAGTRPLGSMPAYSASKRFQQALITALEQRSHHQKAHIQFTDIRPGWVRTPLVQEDKEYPFIMSLDYAAPLVEAAILKGKRVATVDWRWRLACSLWRAIPQTFYKKLSI